MQKRYEKYSNIQPQTKHLLQSPQKRVMGQKSRGDIRL